MNEKELGRALLSWDARGPAPTMDPQKLVASVLARDKRRVRLLTAATIALWTLSAVGIPLFTYVLVFYIWPASNALMQEVITHQRGIEPQDLEKSWFALTAFTAKASILLVSGSVIAFLLAAGATIWLVFATRRATLREVNANLAEIAEQLRRLGVPGQSK
jgi:hypothetical protein